MGRKRYQEEEVQMIIDNYDHSISMNKNSKALAAPLNRTSHAVLEKLVHLRKKGILVTTTNPSQVVTTESFIATILNLALSRIDKEEKQKLILKLMSEI